MFRYSKKIFNKKYINLRTLTSSLYNVETLKINNTEESIVKGGVEKYQKLHSGFKDVKQIGIIGWGSQAPSQYQNINDTLRSINSNINLKIGLRENSHSYGNALNTKGVNECNIGEMYEVMRESDLNLLLISDKAQCDNYEKIFENLKPGSTLGLSHGFLLGYLKNEKKYFPEDINVILMAPKGMGPSLRKLYLEGNGINSSIAIEQDVDGRATDLAISWGLAVGSPNIFETTMEKEYVSDLFGERAMLLGGIYGMVEYLYKDYSKLYSKDKAFIKSSKNLTNLISKKISKNGLINIYKNMNKPDKYIFEENFNKSYKVCKELFNEIYNEVESGNEIRSVILQGDGEMSDLENTEMWKIGKKLEENEYQDYKDKSRIDFGSNVHLQDDYYYMYNIHPKTAGLYLGGIIAQVDVLLENGHSYSEIVNESIIEATDSLNPYMDEKGLAHMIDNCSTTARLGARKWGPRLEKLLEQDTDLIGKNNIVNNFNYHIIHKAVNELYKFK